MVSIWRAPGLAGQRADRGLGLGDDAGVALLLAHLDQFDIVFERLPEARDAIDAVVERLALAHQLLGFLRVVPETGGPRRGCSGSLVS
jgi:hypothetical protein